jgi:hypothetical protein
MLVQLKKQSGFRKFAVHEENKRQIAQIFERINEARLRLGVLYYLIVLDPVLMASLIRSAGN